MVDQQANPEVAKARRLEKIEAIGTRVLTLSAAALLSATGFTASAEAPKIPRAACAHQKAELQGQALIDAARICATAKGQGRIALIGLGIGGRLLDRMEDKLKYILRSSSVGNVTMGVDAIEYDGFVRTTCVGDTELLSQAANDTMDLSGYDATIAATSLPACDGVGGRALNGAGFGDVYNIKPGGEEAAAFNAGHEFYHAFFDLRHHGEVLPRSYPNDIYYTVDGMFDVGRYLANCYVNDYNDPVVDNNLMGFGHDANERNTETILLGTLMHPQIDIINWADYSLGAKQPRARKVTNNWLTFNANDESAGQYATLRLQAPIKLEVRGGYNVTEHTYTSIIFMPPHPTLRRSIVKGSSVRPELFLMNENHATTASLRLDILDRGAKMYKFGNQRVEFSLDQSGFKLRTLSKGTV